MTAKQIIKALATQHWDYRKQSIVPNCHFLGWEADLLVLSKAGYLDEVEIKVSVADFKREFVTKTFKHEVLAFNEDHRRHRFWFAVPFEIVDQVSDLVPAYAGLLAIYGSIIQIRKKAPTLKGSRKLTWAEQLKLTRLGSLRYWTHFDKLHDLE